MKPIHDSENVKKSHKEVGDSMPPDRRKQNLGPVKKKYPKMEFEVPVKNAEKRCDMCD